MGQRFCRPPVFGDLPTRIRILVDGSEDSETLNLIPDSYESLLQSLYPFAAKHLAVSDSDYLVLVHMRTASSGVKFARQKEYRRALKRCKGKEMVIKITKANYASALDLPLHTSDDPATNEFLKTFSANLSIFKSTILEFSHCLHQLLRLASHMSEYTLHPSIESAITAVLLVLSTEHPYTDEALGLTISSKLPFITVATKELKPMSVAVMRLWNDFVLTMPKLQTLIGSLNQGFQELMEMLTQQMIAVKKKSIGNPEAVMRAKQCFEDASFKCEAVEHQLNYFFSHPDSHRLLSRVDLLRRINGRCLATLLTTALGLYDLRGNAK